MSTSTSTAEAEAAALRALAVRELSGLPSGIGGMHDAISGRVFGALGPLGAPVRVVHDAAAHGAYRGVRGGLRQLFSAAGSLVASPAGDRALSANPWGAGVIAAVNGLIGDTLEREGSVLAQPMSFRARGAVVARPD